MGDRTPVTSTCPHCAGPLLRDMKTSDWTVSPLIRDSFSMIGTAVGGTSSAFYGFNKGDDLLLGINVDEKKYHLPILAKLHCQVKPYFLPNYKFPSTRQVKYYLTGICLKFIMPNVRKFVKGPMWLHFLIGSPPVVIFSAACAGLAGGAVPAIAQLVSSSFNAAVSSSSLSHSHSQEHTSSSPLYLVEIRKSSRSSSP